MQRHRRVQPRASSLKPAAAAWRRSVRRVRGAAAAHRQQVEAEIGVADRLGAAACRPSARRSAACRRAAAPRGRRAAAPARRRRHGRGGRGPARRGRRPSAAGRTGSRRRRRGARELQACGAETLGAALGHGGKIEQHESSSGALAAAAARKAPSPPPTSSRQRCRAERIGVEHFVGDQRLRGGHQRACSRRPARSASATPAAASPA